MDIAVVGILLQQFAVHFHGCRVILDVRIALGSVAPTPVRAIKTEAFLKGKEYSEENIRRASEIASTEIRPISDVRASADYRREVVKSLIEIIIQKAAERIRGS